MNQFYKRTLVLAGVVVTAGLSIYSHFGPALAFGLGRTGAPFDGAYCSSCHSGGSFSPTMSIELLQGSPAVVPNVSVTSYVPGSAYTVRINRAAVGLPPTGGFGFQITCATLPGANTDVNAWGALPVNTHSTQLGSGATLHTYIEHSDKLSSAIPAIDIPWTGPAAGTGTLKFYAAVNTVNGNSSSSGDQPIISSLQVTVNPLPVTWLYFNGKEDAGNVLLNWATSNEAGNGFFTLEKSRDGQNFQTVATIDATKQGGTNNAYSYTDRQPYGNTYYRISQTDVSGNRSYFRTIQVKMEKASSAMHYVEGNSIVLQLQSMEAKEVVVSLYSIEGRKVSTQKLTVQEGGNTIRMEKPGQTGIYLLSVQSGKENIYAGKVLVE